MTRTDRRTVLRTLAALFASAALPACSLLPGSSGRTCRRVVVLGDPHLPGPNLADKERLLAQVNGWDDVDLVVAMGDLCEIDGSEAEYAAVRAFFARLDKPLVAIAGNHDYYFRDMAVTEGHYRISPPDEQAVKLDRFRRTFGLRQLYTSRRLGGYLLVFLSTDHQNFGTGIGPAQFTWLRRLLARNRTTPTIVFFHAPLRGTQAKFRHYIDRPSAIAQPEAAVEELLAANPQVFLWVSGHTHTPPTEPSYAAPINRFQDRVTNIHNTDLRGAMLWTNSLFLCPDRVEVRTYNHTTGHCLPDLDRTIVPPLVP